MAKVFRVETSGGRGMYSVWYELDLGNSDAHPCVYEDSLYMENAEKFNPALVDRRCGVLKWSTYPVGHRFGFESLDQLRRWIFNDDWIKKLSDVGCVLCVYEVPDIALIVGRTQVTFSFEMATLIERSPLANIL